MHRIFRVYRTFPDTSLDTIWVKFEDQGQRSKFTVTKKNIAKVSEGFLYVLFKSVLPSVNDLYDTDQEKQKPNKDRVQVLIYLLEISWPWSSVNLQLPSWTATSGNWSSDVRQLVKRNFTDCADGHHHQHDVDDQHGAEHNLPQNTPLVERTQFTHLIYTIKTRSEFRNVSVMVTVACR